VVELSGDETITAAPLGAARIGGQRFRWLSAVHPIERVNVRPLCGAPLTIGRDPDAGGLAFDDSRMSRSHCRLELVPEYDVVRVEDLGSKNGTFIDGKRITREYLEHGSVLRVGETLLVYGEVLERRKDAQPLELAPGRSPLRAQVEQLADLIAPERVPVLINGPTGAGKELLARRLHEKSGRKGRLVAVNSAGLNRELLASELFGHVAGAFSGARASREGLFVAAENGTLFLDEIGDLPLDQQPALLRALQEQRIRPVGSDRERDVDVRVVCATNLDLEELVRQGQFRGDLLARISVLRLELPGLARRREEILPLFREYSGASRALSLDAAETMLLHGWPRNIRELIGVAEEMRLLVPEGVIERAHLPERLRSAKTESAQPALPDRDQLQRLLREHAGNVAEVARALGEHRQSIYRWMKLYHLDAAAFREV
jgi:DNA-binding NtrC family response regulator